jgi:hypothetical protein
VPFDPNASTVDYDMRGYWSASGGKGWTSGSHFPDTYKTPYDTTFSAESKYAKSDTPFVWRGDTLIDKRSGNPVSYSSQQSVGGIGATSAASAGTAGVLTAGSRIWRGGQPTMMSGAGGGPPFPLDPSTVTDRGIGFLDQDRMVANILASYGRTEGTWMRPAGETWYPAAREWTKEILRLTGSDMDLDRATSIVAQLSENTSWPMNMQRFIQYASGQKVGATGSNLGRVKAIAEADDPLSAVRGPKINNFVRSILGRFHDAVAVDRWAARIALGTGDKELAQKILGRAGAYESMADAYRTAAGQVGISPSELQAVTWVEGGPNADASIPDATIQNFKETGEWRFPITPEEVARLAYEDIKGPTGGTTIDLSGHRATQGFAYSPSKKTETPFDPDTVTEEDVLRYIQGHQTELRRPGAYFGGGTDEGEGFMDVSRVGPASPDVIAAAQKAKQVGVWDFEAPEGQQWVTIGTMDDHGGYHPSGTAADLYAQHRGEVERATGTRGLGSDPEVSRGESPPGAVPDRGGPEAGVGKLPKVSGKGGPGAAMARQPASFREIAGNVTRIAGPILTVAGDAFTAYGLVAQAAAQGQQEEVAQGHVVVQGPGVLGIHTGTAFPDPTFHSGQSSFGHSPDEVNYWLKYGRWPAQADVTIGPGNGAAGDDQLDHFAAGYEHGQNLGQQLSQHISDSMTMQMMAHLGVTAQQALKEMGS